MPRTLKLLAKGTVAVVLALVALGLVLPRDLRIERKLELGASLAAVAAEVNDLSRWQSWAFGAEAQGCAFTDAREEALRWTCGDVAGALLRTDVSPQALWVDARVAGQMENVRMKITLAEAPTGTQLRWEEQARAPRVMGAWLRPWLERARGDEIDRALVRLRDRLQANPQKGT